MNIDVAEQIRTMEAELARLRTRIEQADATKDAEIKRLIQRCVELSATGEVGELRRCNLIQARTLRELRNDEAQRNARIEELRKELAKALKQASDAQQRADDRGRELTELTATLVATRNEMITTRALLNEARDKSEKLEKRLIEAQELAEARRVHGLEGEHTANAVLQNTEELLKLAGRDLTAAHQKLTVKDSELVMLRDELQRAKSEAARLRNHLNVYQGKAKVGTAIEAPADIPSAYAISNIPPLPCGLKMTPREAWLEKKYIEVVDILGKVRHKLKVVPTSGHLLLDLVWELWTLLGMRGN